MKPVLLSFSQFYFCLLFCDCQRPTTPSQWRLLLWPALSLPLPLPFHRSSPLSFIPSPLLPSLHLLCCRYSINAAATVPSPMLPVLPLLLLCCRKDFFHQLPEQWKVRLFILFHFIFWFRNWEFLYTFCILSLCNH